MKIEDVKKLSPIDTLNYWIQERERIRLDRLSDKQAPWTDDEILQRYRFCNVRRMDDAVSQWLINNWYKPNYNHPNCILACAVARFINLPSSLEVIGYPIKWDRKAIKNLLRKERSKVVCIFNSAYMVRGNDGEDKVSSVVDYYIQPLVDTPPLVDGSSLESGWSSLVSYYGFGSFMAGQVMADLRWAMRGAWEDKLTWAPAGPGSIRGMNRIMGRPVKHPTTQAAFLQELRELISELLGTLPIAITKRLEAIDYQNCLCEIDKYMRTLSGTGKPKRLFVGGHI